MMRRWNVMRDTEKHVDDEAKNKLADLLQDAAKFTSWDYVHYNRESAMDIVETVMSAGWAPAESNKENTQ
jgi:hypothetical protein